MQNKNLIFKNNYSKISIINFKKFNLQKKLIKKKII